MKKQKEDLKKPATVETHSIRKTLGIAAVAASLGTSLGINVGDLLAVEKMDIGTKPVTFCSGILTEQQKLSDQIKFVQAEQIKLSDEIGRLQASQIKWEYNKLKSFRASEFKLSKEIKLLQADEVKLSNQIKLIPPSEYKLCGGIKNIKADQSELSGRIDEIQANEFKLSNQIKVHQVK